MNSDFETFNSLKGLNSVGIALIAFVLFTLFYILLRIFRKVTKIAGFAKKLEKKLFKNVFFAMLIIPFLEGFHDIAFFAILTISVGANEPFGELLSYMLAWFCVAVFIVILLICFYLLWN